MKYILFHNNLDFNIKKFLTIIDHSVTYFNLINKIINIDQNIHQTLHNLKSDKSSNSSFININKFFPFCKIMSFFSQFIITNFTFHDFLTDEKKAYRKKFNLCLYYVNFDHVIFNYSLVIKKEFNVNNVQFFLTNDSLELKNEEVQILEKTET